MDISIADNLLVEDRRLNGRFKLFLEFADDYKDYPGNPCSPPQPTYDWLKSIANSDTETAFGAEAALAAIDDQVLDPTPLKWSDEQAGKRDKQQREPEGSNLTEDLWVYPVPASGELHIRASENGQFILLDINGRVLLSKVVEEGTQTVQLTEIPSGYYIAFFKGSVENAKRAAIIISR